MLQDKRYIPVQNSPLRGKKKDEYFCYFSSESTLFVMMSVMILPGKQVLYNKELNSSVVLGKRGDGPAHLIVHVTRVRLIIFMYYIPPEFLSFFQL